MRLFGKIDGKTNTRFDRAVYLTPPYDLSLAIQYPNQPGGGARREASSITDPIRRSASELAGVLQRADSEVATTLKRG